LTFPTICDLVLMTEWSRRRTWRDI